MLTLFTNGFSPFARKVAMALEYKDIAHESIDGLSHANRNRLTAVNPRTEVPTLVDGDVTIVNSSDIVAYLDQKYPERPIYPADMKARVDVRALERMADVRIDAIMLTCSIWTWADRKDEQPPGMQDAAQRDLDANFARIEESLATYPSPMPFGHWTVAEFALWPHLTAVRALGFTMDAAQYPRLTTWFAAMRRDELFLEDARRTREYLKTVDDDPGFERAKIFWRGDRIEWLLARGFHDWFFKEIREDRVLWPD
jgi:glutathione S-transferase